MRKINIKFIFPLLLAAILLYSSSGSALSAEMPYSDNAVLSAGISGSDTEYTDPQKSPLQAVDRIERMKASPLSMNAALRYTSDEIPPEPEPETPIITADSKLIALTFDDGPGKYTEELLDKLAACGVPATFFVLGNCAARYPDIVKRIYDEGHEIGIHTYTHPNLTKLGRGSISKEVARTADAITAAAPDCAPVLFRPPGGSYNKTVRGVCEEYGLAVVLWSVDTRDWQSRNVTAILNATFKEGAYGATDGAIILLHDIHKTTVESVDQMIERLQSEGYTFVTVSQLLELRRDGSAPGAVYTDGKPGKEAA